MSDDKTENAELRAEVTAQQHQLVDKERELIHVKSISQSMAIENDKLHQQLTAANAVCEAYDLVVSDYNTTGRCTNLRRENLRNKLAELRKLQGGDGDE